MQNQKGFLLIGFLIALAIMIVLAALYFRKSGNGQNSPAQANQKAIQQAKTSNAALEQQNQIIKDQMDGSAQ